MCKFGISFEGPPPVRGAIPEGFAPAELRLGNFVETTLCDLSFWSKSDYVGHWLEAARLVLGGDTRVLFCAELTEKNVSLFVGEQSAGIVRFQNVLAPRSDITINGWHVSAVVQEIFDDPGPNVSRWSVPIEDVECFVRQVGRS